MSSNERLIPLRLAVAALIVLGVFTASALASESPQEPHQRTVATAAQSPQTTQGDTDKRLLTTTTTTTTAPPPPTTTTTQAPPTTETVAVAPAYSGGGNGDPYDDASWYRLYECENGGYGWSANTGNGYYGGLQFSLSSWAAVGGTDRPDQASPDEQIARGKLLWEHGGWAHWPACTRQFGWR